MVISDADFFRNLPSVLKNEDIFIVGLSGGADSLCLTMLLRQYAVANGKKLIACFVDHKLRPESSTEILPIIEILQKHDIDHKVLIWDHEEDIGGNIERKAREARYKLLFDFCRVNQSNSLFIAHHKLDQWETFFMRLSRGSSLKGLSAIKKINVIGNIKIIRPMLSFSPSDIKETLQKRFSINNYVFDPSNDEIRFERVRWRKSYDELKKYGLDMDNVCQSIDRLQTANDCLEDMAKSVSEQLFDGNYLNIVKFRSLHLELQIRVLDCIIKSVFLRNNIISYSLLSRVSSEICDPYFSAINIAGIVFRRDKTKNIKLFPENRK